MRYTMATLALAVLVGCAAPGKPTVTAPPVKEIDMHGFSTTRVDFGIVVSDIDKALAFYRDGLGLVDAGGFDVPAEMGGGSGLSDDKAFHVHVLKVADEPNATQVKIMAFPDTPGKRVDNAFISSSYGIRYLTLYVDDVTAAIERARSAGAMAIAKGPVELPPELATGVFLAVVRDPDGNMIELVGPKKE